MSEKQVLEVLSSKPHPFTVQLEATFQDNQNLYMVLEYVIGGEFFSHLRAAEHFDSDTSRFYAAQVLLVFEHMHSMNIIYRDLKPEVSFLTERVTSS